MIESTEILAHEVGVMMLEAELEARAAARTEWPACAQCGRRLRSKGQVERCLTTSLGRVHWRRRVGRCPGGCRGSYVAPLDESLGLEPQQRHSTELKIKATLLAVFVPVATAASIVRRLARVEISASTIWGWIQDAGQRATAQLEADLARLAQGGTISQEAMDEVTSKLLMLIGADGVMVPFRPNGGSPKGRTVWREVRVGIIARLQRVVNRTGRSVTRLRQRRLVAVLGNCEALGQRLELEALRQGLASAAQVAWLSDGAKCLWRIFEERFAKYGTIGILDFYHCVGQLWSAAEAWYHRWMPSAHSWLSLARHDLRHGAVAGLIDTLRRIAPEAHRKAKHRATLRRVANYLDAHREHLAYPAFSADGMPLGSGFVESAVKWLIQQRFKGVGMRWSEQGFNNLLMLRLAWANDHFDTVFLPSPNF